MRALQRERQTSTTPSPRKEAGSPAHSDRHGVLWARLLLLAGLSVTVVAVFHTKSTVDAAVEKEFGFVCSEIQTRIQDRLRSHEQILRSGAAFFSDEDGVSREEWNHFADRQRIDQRLPGIQGLGFAQSIPRPMLSQHVLSVRAEGFPGYRVWPEGERELYSAITYLEPFTNRNLRAFGFDMLSETVRREAMERARDQDAAALSGKVRLVQETDQDVQAGTLMYVPVYRSEMPCQSLDERRAALLGWVYSPYRMNDLMAGILGGWDHESGRRVRLEIFDGEQADPATLLYDSRRGEDLREASSLVALQRRLVSAGRPWTLRLTQVDRHVYAREYGKVWLVLFAGTTVSLLLFWLYRNLLAARTAWRKTQNLAAELGRSEEKHRRLVDNSPSILFALGTDGVLTFASPSWTVLLGHPVADVIGRGLQSFVHPDDQEMCRGWMRDMAETGQRRYGAEYRVQHCDGTWRQHSTNAAPLHDERGTVIGFEGTAIDITERKRLEATLRESESRFDQLAERSGTFVWEVDAQGRYTFISRVVEAVLGYRPDELVGRMHFYDFHPEAGRAAFAQAAFAVFARKDPFHNLVNPAVTKDGRSVWLSTNGIPLLNADGTLRGYRGGDSDITERTQMAERLQANEIRLKQSEKMEALGQLAGGVAHDFNNVLCGIIGYADMSLEYGQPGSVLEANLNAILKASERARQLVRQILTFTRQDSAPETATFVYPVIQEVLELLRASIPSSVVIVASDLQEDAGPVLADTTKVHEMLVNLAANAVHAMRQKGTLTVRLHAESLDRKTYGRIGELAAGDYAVIEVADTGCGMDATTLSKAFDPFFTTKAVNEGTGMGLSVVRGIVQSHGGDIQVESEVGKGTTFRVFIPVTRKPPTTVSGDAPTVCQGGHERILFVDDEPLLVEMARSLLSSLGYAVTAVSDSAVALELIKARAAEFDLLITDQTMPGMTGIELAKAALAVRRDLPIILCTGFSNEVSPRRIAAIGIRQLVMKPYMPHELGGIIRSILGGKGGT